MANKNEQRITKVITDPVRLTYAFVWKPNKMDEDSEPKYSTCFLIPKEDKVTLRKVKAAIQTAAEQGAEKYWGGKIPSKKFKIPLRDGDEEAEEKGEEFSGHWFINATSKQAPGIVDKRRIKIEDESEVYSGCFARLSVNFYPFDTKGSKGIACGLNNIQKISDGEPLGGARVKAEEDFDDWEGDENGDLFGEDDGDSAPAPTRGKKQNIAQGLFDDDDDIAA